MTARTLMVFGTSSDAGKSTLVAGLCRVWAREGLSVAPFKAQNMARNAFVCADGGEIGVAQAVQAVAAGVVPCTDHNPVLLKPEPDMRSQLVLLGQSQGSYRYRELWEKRPQILAAVEAALGRLRAAHDLVVLEGAGSPAEVNLHAHDIPNLAAVRCADARVILVADIDRGGVFATILGTLDLLPPDVRARMCGLVINKFRGDVSLLDDGLRFIEQRSGLPVLGVVPHMGELGLPDEDSLAQSRYRSRRRARLDEIEIAVVDTPCLANFEDVLPLAREPGVLVRLSAEPRELLEADLVILPGSKATAHDLAFIYKAGIAPALQERARRSAPLLGICGGAQLLGERIEDPDAVESGEPVLEALGILPHITRFEQPKRTTQCSGTLHAFGGSAAVSGFVLHHGRLRDVQGTPALQLADGQPEGHVRGEIVATMLHRLFDTQAARDRVLEHLRARRGIAAPEPGPEAQDPYEQLADHLVRYLDCDKLRRSSFGERA
ncbi:MAG TPA: cobyric acid synthase [Polyangiales bacterium]|nr:cobyric acid synthase [Polyangiales bacterium]